MLYRKFGKTNEEVSILGYGCMRFPIIDNDNNKINEEEAIKLVRHAIDNGVNYIDTAFPYHGGNSEEFIGKALRDGYREKVHLATKLPSWSIHSREDMDKYLDIQLERLNTESIDFYLLHALDKKLWANYLKHDVFDFIKKAKESGKIKHIGFSFHDKLDVFKEIVDGFDWEFCLIQYNFMDEYYQAGIEGLQYAAAKGMGIAVMEPLRGGRLAKNVPDDIMKIWKQVDEKRSPAQWAMRFVWNHPEVGLLLSGMNEIAQIDENIEGADKAYPETLTDKESAAIDKVKEIYKSRMAVDCTYCQYCMPCPVGVSIPQIFDLLNTGHMFDDMENAKEQYNMFVKDENKASKCVECGECEDKCPQHIEIRKMLKEAVEEFEK
jgi:hypothetical protein